MSRNLITKLTTASVVAVLVAAIQHDAVATVTVLSHWRMGEEAGDTDGRLDSVATRHFLTNPSPVEFTTDVSPAGNGSSVAANTRGNSGSAGFYGVNTGSFMPTDNFGIEMWVRSDNTSQNIGIMRQDGVDANGHLKFEQVGGVWAASYHNVDWIGANSGTGQTATAEQWTHLAVVRDGGTSTLYIDGVAQAGTTAGAPVWGSGMHLGVMPGGLTGWSGDFDEVRAFSFAPGQFDTSDLLLPQVATAPEPSTLILMTFGLMSLGLRRRRTNRK